MSSTPAFKHTPDFPSDDSDMSESIKLISHKPLEDYVTVLAIYDDPPVSSSENPIMSRSKTFAETVDVGTKLLPISSNLFPRRSSEAHHAFSRHSIEKNVSTDDNVHSNKDNYNHVVEVTTFDHPPTRGLQVDANGVFGNNEHFDAVSFTRKSSNNAHERSASTERSSPQQLLVRNHARKSRFTDAYINAKDRLDKALEDGANVSAAGGSLSNFRHSKIVFSADTANTFTGLEVSAVPNPDFSDRIVAVEVMRIEDGSRVNQDGRLKVGDQITNINGQSCSEMSLAKARRCLRDLEFLAEPSLAFNRRIHRRASETQKNSVRPIHSALQQANTSKIGDTLSITINKNRDGFGFGFAGRINAAGEHLYYITTLKPNGASYGHLQIGDRLLQVDDMDLSNVPQSEVTKLLKSKNVGESIVILTSRVTENSTSKNTPSATFIKPTDESDVNKSLENEETTVERNSQDETKRSKNINRFDCSDEFTNSELAEIAKIVARDGQHLVTLEIALNDSPSAGLGVSLKAQKIYNDNETVDSGLYIRKLLHGSAAFKDGRLHIDDRLIAIENVNLLNFELNAEALKAFTNCLTHMHSSTRSIKIMIARRAPYKKSNETKKAEFVLKSDDISLFSLCDKTNENIPGTEESESETSVLMDDDAFVRNTVTRKSMSEKRPLGAHSDPSHLQTYQRIKHFRQTSAPALACGIEMLRSKFTPGGCKTNEKNSFHRRSIGAANRRLSFADQHMMSRDKFSITASKPHVYESKTLPLKLKMNGDPCKKISRFFDFFKQSSTSTQAFKSYVTNCNNSDNETRLIEQEPSSLYKKELGEKYASPGRRSVSFDQFGFESAGTGSRESRLATSLDQIKTRESKRANTNNATAVTKMITSVSQPALRTKGTDSETCKLSLPKEKSLTCTAIVEKRNRRKSTGSSLLKLFQKSSPTAASQLYAEDEKAAAKYTILLEEQKKLNVMDDAFRRETLNRQVNTAYLSSSRSEPRAPPPSYHQFVQHGYSAPPSLPSQFFPFKQCNSLQSPQVTAYGIAPIKHSAHELPNDSFICQNCFEMSSRTSNSIRDHKYNENMAHYIIASNSDDNQNPDQCNQQQQHNKNKDESSRAHNYTNLTAVITPPDSPRYLRHAAINQWNADHLSTGSVSATVDKALRVLRNHPSVHDIMNDIVMLQKECHTQMPLAEFLCNPMPLQSATTCPRHHLMSRASIYRQGNRSVHRQAWNIREDLATMKPPYPSTLTHLHHQLSLGSPPYNEITTMTHSTHGSPAANPPSPLNHQRWPEYHNITTTNNLDKELPIRKHSQTASVSITTSASYKNLSDESNQTPILCNNNNCYHMRNPQPSYPPKPGPWVFSADHASTLAHCPQCEWIATNIYTNLTNSDTLSSQPFNRNHQQNITTDRLTMKKNQGNIRTKDLATQSFKTSAEMKHQRQNTFRLLTTPSSPSHSSTDYNNVPTYTYFTEDNVTNISLESHINVPFASPVTAKRLGNASLRVNTQPVTARANFSSKSLNDRKTPKNKPNVKVNQNVRQQPHVYCQSARSTSHYNTNNALRHQSSHHQRSKMRRAVESAVFYDDCDHL